MSDIDTVATTLAGIINGALDGKGLNLPMTEIPKLIGAGKRIKEVPEGGKQVMTQLFRKVEASHPELLDLILAGISESAKDKIREKLGAGRTVDAEVVR